VGQLPLLDDREGLAEAALGARGGDSNCPLLGVHHMVVLDAAHLANEVVDWMWLDMTDPDFFVLGSALGGRAVVPPDWPLLTVRVDFTEAGTCRRIFLCDRCHKGGCGACRSISRHLYRLVAKLRMGCPRGQPSGTRGGGAGGGSTNVGSIPRGPPSYAESRFFSN